MNAAPSQCLQLQSLITSEGEIQLSLNVTDVPERPGRMMATHFQVPARAAGSVCSRRDSCDVHCSVQ